MSDSSGSHWRSDGEGEKEGDHSSSDSDTGLAEGVEAASDAELQDKQEDDAEDAPSAQELEDRRQANIQALLSGR